MEPIKSISKPRQGWEEEFRKMHEKGDDQLLIDDVFGDGDLSSILNTTDKQG